MLVEGCKHEIEITVPVDEITRETDRVVATIQQFLSAGLVDELHNANALQRSTGRGHVSTPSSARPLISAADMPSNEVNTSSVSSPRHGGPRPMTPPVDGGVAILVIGAGENRTRGG